MLETALVYRPIIPSCPKCKRGIPDGEGHTFCTAIREWGDDAETEEYGGWCKFFREKKHKKKKGQNMRLKKNMTVFFVEVENDTAYCREGKFLYTSSGGPRGNANIIQADTGKLKKVPRDYVFFTKEAADGFITECVTSFPYLVRGQA